MRLALRRESALSLWRIVYAISACFLLAYILFDVLDLDGSDFPLKRTPMQRPAVAVEISKHPLLTQSTELPKKWLNLTTNIEFREGQSASFNLRKRPIRSHRVPLHLVRTALPRSSPSDDPLPSL
jgi:hypothetical protein